GFKPVNSGVWPGKIPSSPSVPVATIIFTAPENSGSSALTISQCKVFAMGLSLIQGSLASLPFVVALENFVDRAFHVEILLWNVVVFTRENSFKACDGFC